jgi:hypothetical protein
MHHFNLLTNDDPVSDRSVQSAERELGATDVLGDDAAEPRESTSPGGDPAEAAIEVGSNLALVLAAWNTIVQSGSTRDLAAILDEHVIWQGAMPDSVSRGRDEVVGVLADNPAPHLTRIEAREVGDQVLLTMEGPDFPLTEGHHAGIRSLVFTFRTGAVAKMESIGKQDRTSPPAST